MFYDLAYPLTLYFLPALLLALFYAHKNKHMVWLTIPVTLAAHLLCFCRLLDKGMVLYGLALHMAGVAVCTGIAALLRHIAKKPLRKRLLVVLISLICAAALGFTAHTVLSGRSVGYREMLDRPVFARLTKIRPQDVERIQVYDPAEKLEGAERDFRYNGGAAFFAGLEYLGPLPSDPQSKALGVAVGVELKNGKRVMFSQHTGDEFSVAYMGRVFYVRSPQLLADLTR